MKKIQIILITFITILINQTMMVAQQASYTDAEIGFNESEIRQRLVQRGIESDHLEAAIASVREMYVQEYVQSLEAAEESINDTDIRTASLPSRRNRFRRNLSRNTAKIQSRSKISNAIATCPVSEQERQALIDLYNSTGGPNWRYQWDFSKPVCEWRGVSVSQGNNANVVELNLSGYNMTGSIPESIGNLKSLTTLNLRNNLITKLPNSLGNLSDLQTLNVSRSPLNQDFPKQILNLTNLSILDLSFCQLSGQIPNEISKLLRLKNLILSHNNLTGNIPETLWNIIGLEQLFLNNNYNLGGIIPSEIANLQELKGIHLTACDFNGDILPKLIKCKKITSIHLWGNNFSGNIPNNINILQNLQYFRIGNNKFSGKLPSSLCDLIDLNFLSVDNNNFEGNIPENLGNLSKLIILDLGNNAFTGGIPDSFKNFSNLQRLFLNGIGLTGNIPSFLGNLSNLSVFSLNRNQFSGNIPESFANLKVLKILSLSRNNLSGVIPSNISQLPNFKNFFFDINNFVFSDFEPEHPLYESKLSSYQYTPQAKVDQEETLFVEENASITLTTNALTSPNNSYQWYKDGVAIPDATSKELVISNASDTDAGVYHFIATNSIITDLTLERHPITLSVTEPLCGVSESEKQALLDFYNSTNGDNWKNTLSGNKPWDPDTSVCNWYGITVEDGKVVGLRMPDNNVVGQLSNTLSNLVNLERFVLYRNSISGSLPDIFDKLTRLKFVSLEMNKITGNIPESVGMLANLFYINLNNNDITGNIPISFGNLSKLQHLFISGTQLSGSIPTELGAINGLETLAISSNNLSGVIPLSISQLQNLSYFEFSKNNFVFSDFEREHTIYKSKFPYYQYTPQAKVDQVESLSVEENASITLTTNALTSPNNSYQWYKDGVAIPDATSKELVISNASDTDAGVYHFIATNSIITDLTLERHPITLSVTEPLCGVSESEKQALLDFYNSTNGDNWKNTLSGNKPWDPDTSVCDWFGVTVVDGKVTDVNLEGNSLVGSLPDSLNNLLHLETLNLGKNQLNGDIPSSIGGLQKLKTLILDQNELKDEIPVSLGSLLNLVTLKLNNNELQGKIPISFCNLSQLEVLELSNNQLSGILIPEIGSIKNLVYLDVSHNQLSGKLPYKLQNLFRLEFIALNNNRFNGIMPNFVILSKLSELQFEDNRFIFSDFEAQHDKLKSRLTNYTYAPQADVDEVENKSATVGHHIELSTRLSSENNTYVWYKDGERIASNGNKVIIDQATIADAGVYYFTAINSTIENLELTRNKITLSVLEVCKVPDVERQALIDLFNATDGLHWNSQEHEDQAWDILNPNSSVCDWHGVIVEDGHVVELNLFNNTLSGSLPESLGNLSKLQVLNLSNNQLLGNIPNQISTLATLTTFNIENNKFIFINVENDFNTYKQLSNFTYVPQDKVDLQETKTVDPGQDITLTTSVLVSEANQYQWSKNGLPIEGATNKEYTITNVTAEDAGMYSFEATNTVVSNLTLQRRVIELEVTNPNNGCNVSNIEKEALIALYRSTNGSDWSNQTNWLTDAPVCDWYGVTVEDGKVVQLNLANNQLEGTLPDSISQLKDLVTIHLYGNNLSGNIESNIVDLTNLNSFLFQNNSYVFSDFENEHPTYTNQITGQYNFTPQAKVDNTETKTLISGQSITLTSNALTSTNNSYQWYKDGAAIAGATQKEFVINNATDSDAGVYHFTATNSVVKGLTLERNPITLKVLDATSCAVSEAERQALIALYKATDGAHWSNTLSGTNPWKITDTESKVCNWFGITVSDDFKVIGINLPANKLRGEIPDNFGQLQHLKTLVLSQNQLIGAYPEALNPLYKLENLDLSENTFVGAISQNIGDLEALQHLNLGKNRFAGSIPETIGELKNLITLDLNTNKLKNAIPVELYSLFKIKEIKLQNNKLSGQISKNIGNLSQLEEFWVSNNKLSGSIPQSISIENTPNLYSIHLDFNAFSGDLPQLIPNLQLPNTSVQINDNAFIFYDFESEFPQYQAQLDNFVYSPQAFVDINETRYVKLNEATTLSSKQLISSNNKYQWYKRNDQGAFELIPDATSKDYVLTITDPSQYGQYRFIATNTVVTGLELTRRTITVVEFVDTDGDGIPDNEDPDDDNDDCPDTVEIANGSDPLDPSDTNCPVAPDDTYTFCDSQSVINIGNLPIPNGGSTALWFDSVTDSIPIPAEEELYKSQSLWAEVDGSTERIEVPISVNEGAPGILEDTDADGNVVDESFQMFSPGLNPTIANLKITPSEGITWHASPTASAVLPLDTPLVDGGLYFASLNGHPCRFEVEVFLGIPDLYADRIQYFCEANDPTLGSITVVKTKPAYEIRWYGASEGGTSLAESTPLVNGTTYYATQFDGFVESETRTAIEVIVNDIENPKYLNNNQFIVVKQGQIARVSDLMDRDPSIKWYQLPEGGQPYRPSDPLIDGDTYYAAQVNAEATCESNTRLAVTVYIQEEKPPILTGCEKFKPQPGDRYVISGWVREQGVRISNSITKDFITDKAASDRLLALLNHLINDKVLIQDQDIITNRFIKDAYIPDIENKSYDVILPYIENGPSDNLAIYNFKYVKEDKNSYAYSGVSRTIGFQFSFSPDATGDEYDFRYVTPTYWHQYISDISGKPLPRYPIFNNPTMKIKFTGFRKNGNSLEVLSSFYIKKTKELINHNISDYNTPVANIKLKNDFNTYESDPDYQVMDYMNSLIEVVYEGKKDSEGNSEVLSLDPEFKVKFRPKGAIIDGWQRISADFIVPNEAHYMSIVLKNTSGEDINSYFDDIRIHPFASNMKTFVYDPITQRLQSELDENNYATYYEYDKEGGLVRVKKETERGIYTIQETRSGNSKLNK